MAGVDIPISPMKHAYIITESISGAKDMPNVRDHDTSVYFRTQGDSLQIGGYENNPIILKEVANDFQFGLYDLDYSVFDVHLEHAMELCPRVKEAGIKTTVCGPESFTPDHKPIMGEDPRVDGKIKSNY